MNERELLQELCLEYALGTLEGEALTEIESRLASGEAAVAEEVAAARATIAQIGLLAGPEDEPPPAGPRAKLLARVKEELGEPSAEPAIAPAGKARRFPAREALGWAIAASLAVFAYLAWNQREQSDEALAELQQQYERLAADNELFERIRGILAAPETRSVELQSTSNPRVQAYWNEELGLVVAGDGLPPMDPGRTLQLWIVPKEGAPISLGLFEPQPTGRAIYFADPDTPIEDAAALAISEEPDSGSPAPSSDPVWVGPLE